MLCAILACFRASERLQYGYATHAAAAASYHIPLLACHTWYMCNILCPRQHFIRVHVIQGLIGAYSTLLAHGQEEQGHACTAAMTWLQAGLV